MSEVAEQVDSRNLENADPFHIAEKALINAPQLDCETYHHFVPGFYLRELHMPAGSFIISKRHGTDHQFCISKGVVSVWQEGTGWVNIIAPYSGFTAAGTRRALIVHEDTVWTTAHPRTEEETTVEQIEDRIIVKEDNPLLDESEAGLLKEIEKFHTKAPLELEGVTK
jgi:hypothetical protein